MECVPLWLMADGLHPFLFLISSYRDQASPSTHPEARGLPSLAEWNGMGVRGYHRPPFHKTPIISGFHYHVIVLLFSVLMTGESFLKNERKNLDICI